MTSNNRNRNRNRSGNPANRPADNVQSPVNSGPKPLAVSEKASFLETESILQKRATERFKAGFNDPSFREFATELFGKEMDDLTPAEKAGVLKTLTVVGLAEDKDLAFEHYRGAADQMDAMLGRALEAASSGK